MGLKTIAGVHWTNLELEGLLEDEDSCVYLEKVKKHLGLHPFHLTDLNVALREILNSSLNVYDSELNGLLLAYKNPKLLSPLGDILYDTCFVHVDVEADFYIFRPEVGRSLKGFVNKKGTNHVGILLHKAFNVSVPKPDDEEDWPGDQVKVGQEVRFTLEEIDYKTRLPYIRGSLREEEYLNGCKLFDEQIAATFESEFQEITRWNNKGEGLDSKKKISFKTENKRIVFNSDSEVEIDPEDETEKKPSVKKLKNKSDEAEETVKTPTKKRKRKSTVTSESETELIQQKDIEFEAPKNPSKKRKKNTTINDQSPTDTEDERHQKPSISKLLQKKILDDFSEAESLVSNSPLKKQKKKSKKDKAIEESEDERNHKSKLKNLVNQTIDDSTNKESDEYSSKKSKKRKEKHAECLDTEDEREYKSTIDKSLSQKLIENSTNEAESESELPKTHKKKHKKHHFDDIPENSEDERSHKLKLKKLSKELVPNETEVVFEVPREPPKKRKKKTSTSDTSDQLKKISEYEVVDTEDEKGYKSILKPLIESVEQNGQENDSEFKVPKKKKHKKKRTSSSSESELPFDPSTVIVKNEPESETEEVRAIKRKQKKAKKEVLTENDTDSELTEKDTKKSLKKIFKNPLEDQNTDELSPKKSKKRKNSQEYIDSDSGVEELETRRKIKEEKHKKKSNE